MEVKVIGPPYGFHGPYTFYRGFQISRRSCMPSNINSMDVQQTLPSYSHILLNMKNKSVKNKYITAGQLEKDSYSGYQRPLVLALGDCVPVRPWTESPIACLAEVRMIWRSKSEPSLLTGLRLYFLPENTPKGRNCHGEDEVVAISDKVVIRVEDLVHWFDDELEWNWGLIETKGQRRCKKSQNRLIKDAKNKNQSIVSIVSLKRSELDFSDVENARLTATNMRAKIIILSYPQYCRYRAILKRFEGIGDDWSQTSLLTALCGFSSLASNLRVMFCRDSFDYPELEMHEYVCNYLAPKLSGRSRGRKRQSRSISPFSGIKRKYESDSESSDSDVSVYSVKKSKFEEGPSNVLRLNHRQLRNKVKSDVGINCVDRHKLKRDKSAISKYTDKNIHEQRFIKSLPEKTQLWKGKNSPNFKNSELIKTTNSCTEESFFLRKLHEFHVKQNNNIPKMFWISLKGVHLYAIFRQVKKLGGYDAVTSRKQWKKLFGEDSPAHCTISRRKYEKILLPLERSELVNRKSVKIEIKKECDNYEKLSHKVLSLKVKIKKENNLESACNIKSEFGREYMEKIQDKVKSNQNVCNNINEKQESEEYKPSITSERRISVFSNCVNPVSVPLTVILGATDNLENSTSERHVMQPMTTSSSSKAAVSSTSPTQKIEIQQPHTTITFHQTRIRPNKHSKISAMESQITSQIKITNQIQIQQITLQPSPVDISTKCKGAKILCNIKQVEDGQEIQIENINKSHPIVFPVKESQSQKSHIKTKTNRPENKNVPFITAGTTITPLLVPNPTNRTHSEVVHLVGDDEGPSNNDSNRNGCFSSEVQNILPPVKKKKLDILREGGLEVTAISNKYGVISPTASLPILPNEFTHDTEGQALKIKSFPPARTKNNFSSADLYMSATNMYNSNGKVFGNPKDIFPAGLASTGYEEVLDLTVKPSYNSPVRSPQSKPLLSAINLSSKPKLTDNALQITLVPPHITIEKCNSYEDNQNIKNNAQNIMPVLSPLKLQTGTNETVKMDTTLTTSSQNEVFTGSSISSLSFPQYNSQISEGTRSVLNMFNPGLLANLYSQSPNYFSPNQIPQELLELIKNLPSEKSTIPMTKY